MKEITRSAQFYTNRLSSFLIKFLSANFGDIGSLLSTLLCECRHGFQPEHAALSYDDCLQ